MFFFAQKKTPRTGKALLIIVTLTIFWTSHQQIFDAHSCLLALMTAAAPEPMLQTHEDEGIATVALLSAAVRHHATASLPPLHQQPLSQQQHGLPPPSNPGLLDGLLSHQPQLALAAERARTFLCALLTFPAVLSHLQSEEDDEEEDIEGGAHASSLWGIVREAAGMVARQGMPEDRHLCLFSGGWRGLLGWCLRHRMLSEHATMQARVHVESLKHAREGAASSSRGGKSSGAAAAARLGETDEAVLLLDALIYDFPDIVSPPDHNNTNQHDDRNNMSHCDDNNYGDAMSIGSQDNISDDPSANWLDNMCAE